MHPKSTERILAMLSQDARVLDVGGWAAPFNRADWVLDLMPHETRGGLVPGGFGPGPERFSAETWVQRDICDREPWPFEDGFFDFSLCVMTLEDVRDPVWVCSELARVSKAGYVETPSVLHELIYGQDGAFVGHEHHRWLVDERGGEVVFMHKPHSLHNDWRVRVLPRWQREMSLDDHLMCHFWEGELRARERVVVGTYPVDELVELVRERFRPSPLELRLKEGRDRAALLRYRAAGPLRQAKNRALGALRG